ncbi:hypothetical protein E4U42_000981 [Claviceps africana]|uniref:Uncharacterized protein n=1 Tax=Claviceps africana TaxID=83212 RepID=A0A8K0JCG4_9HYPO|nr:hypothetical protein E4U42_000981 [Claviceps africana]
MDLEAGTWCHGFEAATVRKWHMRPAAAAQGQPEVSIESGLHVVLVAASQPHRLTAQWSHVHMHAAPLDLDAAAEVGRGTLVRPWTKAKCGLRASPMQSSRSMGLEDRNERVQGK